MLEILEDAFLDTIKLIPFLFITYLIMEYIENKTSGKMRDKIQKSDKFGPLLGRNSWNSTTMWIFSISYQFICLKAYIDWNITGSIFINF